MFTSNRRFFSAMEVESGAATASANVSPLVQIERITIIDTLRGIALLGILMMNIPFFGMAYQYGFNLDLRNEYSGVNYYTWWAVNGVFEGTMRALFSLLFGAGTVLLLSRLEKKQTGLSAADFYYRRLIWLLIFGLINAFILLWPGDILYSYAVCGLFLFPFRNLKAKYLLMFGLAILLIATFRDTLQFHETKQMKIAGEKALLLEKQKLKLTDSQVEDKEKWTGFQEKQKKENQIKAAEKETKEMHKGYFSIMSHLKNINIKIESSKFYNSYFWDILSLFFIGMAFFKWKILTGERAVKFYWILMLAGYGAGLLLSYWMLHSFVLSRFDMTQMADRIGINYYQVRRLLVTFGHIGLVMLVYKYRLANTLLRWLSRVGQMAFTNYLMQSIICIIIFYGFGFNLYGTLQRYELYIVVGSIWIFQIIFSNIWLKYHRFGPFEWLWRSLTYWKKQPMRLDREPKADIAFT